MNTIYWCEEAGAVFWIEEGQVMYAPMNMDNTANLEAGGVAEDWTDSHVSKEFVLGKLAARICQRTGCSNPVEEAGDECKACYERTMPKHDIYFCKRCDAGMANASLDMDGFCDVCAQ